MLAHTESCIYVSWRPTHFPFSIEKGKLNIPNALQVHGADLDNMANLFALQDAISTATSHSSDIE